MTAPVPSTARRELAKGDRIEAHPCVVTICMVAGPTAGWCETCADHHLIDRQLYEAGGGPWLRVNGDTQ